MPRSNVSVGVGETSLLWRNARIGVGWIFLKFYPHFFSIVGILGSWGLAVCTWVAVSCAV